MSNCRIAFAQPSEGPVTRAEVRGELVQLEHAGYMPSTTYYPADNQPAEARVAACSDAAGSVNTGYGGTAAGMSQSVPGISKPPGTRYMVIPEGQTEMDHCLPAILVDDGAQTDNGPPQGCGEARCAYLQ